MKTEIKSGIYRWTPVTVKRKEGDIRIDIPNESSFYTSKVNTVQKFRTGELLAFKEEGSNKIKIGFSACDPSDMKYYNKAVGRQLAEDIAFKESPIIPASIKRDVAYFALRCKRFFKDCELPSWAKDLMEKYCV